MKMFELAQLVDSAVGLQYSLEGLGFKYCFIGGLAVQYWGEPRMTQDIDLTLVCGFGDEIPLVEKLSQFLSPRILNAKQFAHLNRVYLASDKKGVPIDVSLSGLEFEEEMVERAKFVEMSPAKKVKVCRASDLVILKAFANRERDWGDIRGILIRSRSELDWSQIEKDLPELVQIKDEPEIVSRLYALRDALN